MRLLFILFISTLSFASKGQEFMGVKVEGDKTTFINQFKAKGFAVKGDSSSDAVLMRGTISGKAYELVVVSTPKTKKVWKLSVFLPEATSWNTIKREYEDYLNILTEKYGTPDKKYQFFSSPYYEGDGYEMRAITLEKCNYFAYWNDSIGIIIQISKYKQVKISYENAKNSKLDDLEKKEINSKIF